jgi:hypothetical protein
MVILGITASLMIVTGMSVLAGAPPLGRAPAGPPTQSRKHTV